jgi:hypothetical protein
MDIIDLSNQSTIIKKNYNINTGLMDEVNSYIDSIVLKHVLKDIWQ